MPRLELDDLLRGYSQMTSEQINFMRSFYSRFDYRQAGGNGHITNVEPFHYTGLIAGSEFLTYAATKVYLCWSCQIFDGTAHGEIEGLITFYNELNVAFLYNRNQVGYWEADGRKDEFMMNPFDLRNFYFSRLVSTIYTSVIFNGFRITLN